MEISYRFIVVLQLSIILGLSNIFLFLLYRRSRLRLKQLAAQYIQMTLTYRKILAQSSKEQKCLPLLVNKKDSIKMSIPFKQRLNKKILLEQRQLPPVISKKMPVITAAESHSEKTINNVSIALPAHLSGEFKELPQKTVIKDPYQDVDILLAQFRKNNQLFERSQPH